MARISNPRAGIPRVRVTDYGDVITVIGGPDIDISNVNIEELIQKAIKKEFIAINKEAEILIGELESAEETLKEMEEEEIIRKYAKMRTIERISEVALPAIKSRVIEGMIQTVEYNHPLFIGHMLGALEVQADNLVLLEMPEENDNIYLSMNMYTLGDPMEWLQARKEATISDEYIDLRSHMWEEKYYGVDREGNTITKTYEIVIQRGNKRKGTSRVVETQTKDITHRYTGKYTETIQTRLDLVGSEKAPFWYFVENGNLENIAGEGTPYPKFGPTNFVYKIEVALEQTARELYARFRKEVEDFLVNKYAKMLDLSKVGPKLANLLRNQEDDIARQVIAILEEHEGEVVDPNIQSQLFKFVDDTNTMWALQQRGGTLQLTARRHGRYAGVLRITD